MVVVVIFGGGIRRGFTAFKSAASDGATDPIASGVHRDEDAAGGKVGESRKPRANQI